MPTVKIGESFEYLGLLFDLDMSNPEHKCKLILLFDEPMSDIDR